MMLHHIIFETERLLVRRYTQNDKENFYSLSGDEDVMRYIRAVQTREESDKFLKENIEFYSMYPQMGRWGVEEKLTAKFVGSFAIIFIPGSEKIQLGYSLKKEEWGKGYATELARAGLKYVFEVMKLPLIYAVTESKNTASQKVLLKAGFEQELIFKEGEKELYRFIIHNKSS
jgi:[ribosomal protein S5]-alanine N-acetyltransferase